MSTRKTYARPNLCVWNRISVLLLIEDVYLTLMLFKLMIMEYGNMVEYGRHILF